MSSSQLSTRTKRRDLARRLALAGAALAAITTLGGLTAGPMSAEGSTGNSYYPSGNQFPGLVPRPATGSALTLQSYRESDRHHWVGTPPDPGMHLMIVPVRSEPSNYSADADGPLTRRTRSLSSAQRFLHTFSGRGRWSGN